MTEVPITAYRNRQHKTAMLNSAKCWTPEQEEIVRTEWPLGRLSAAGIGELIGKTRNSVIGKAHRLGLDGRDPKASKHTYKDPNSYRAERTKRERVRAATGAENKMANERLRKAPVVVARAMPLGTKVPIAITELNSFTCRAVVGQGQDGLATYCGDMTFMEKPFCEGHCAMYYIPLSHHKRGTQILFRTKIG